LAHFSAEDARFFTGPRQDSGDPGVFTDLVLEFYRKAGLTEEEISSKVIIYSDGIDSFDRVEQLLNDAHECNVKCSLGIGTWETHDVGENNPPMNMVIKAYEAWFADRPDDVRGCVKVSDNPGKIGGPPKAVAQVKRWLETGEKTWDPPLRKPPIEM
jgi:nicotinic acid phosphoribosyltransferase